MTTTQRHRPRWKLAAAGVLLSVVVAGVFWKQVYTAFVVFRAERQMSMCSLQAARDVARRLSDAESKTGGNDAKLQFLLGRSIRRTGNLEDALSHFKRAEELGHDQEEVRHQRQLILFQRGHLDASTELNRLLRQDLPDDKAYEVYEALAKGYLFSYRFKDALQLLGFWIDWRREATDPRVWRAGVWEQTESWGRAVDEYKEILKIDPRNLEARLSLARILMQRLNKTEEAHSELTKCRELDPNDSATLIGLAACERQLAQPQNAESLLRKVLTSNATKELMTNAKLELGQVLLDLQNVDEAILLLSDVVAETPHDSAAHHAFGAALAAGGNQQKAQEEFAKSKELVAQYARLASITQSLVNNPDNPDLRWEAGDIFMKQGLFTEGAAWMSTALMYDPNHQQTHKSLLHYYETIRKDSRMAEQHRSKLTKP